MYTGGYTCFIYYKLCYSRAESYFAHCTLLYHRQQNKWYSKDVRLPEKRQFTASLCIEIWPE